MHFLPHQVVCVYVRVCVCVCALTDLSNSGLRRRYTLTNSGLGSQQGTFLKSPVGHALNHAKIMSKTLW